MGTDLKFSNVCWELEFRTSTKKDKCEGVHLEKTESLTDTSVSSPRVKLLDLDIQTHSYLSSLCIIISLSGVNRKALGICSLLRTLTGLGIC